MASDTGGETGEFGDLADDDLPGREWVDLLLPVDLVEAASDLSTPPLLVSKLDNEFLGLSDLPLPGILERKEPRKDRVDSLVSDLLKDGYDWSPSPTLRSPGVEASPFGGFVPSRVFDGCCPIPPE